jgi:DNA-binding transcriptional ArsR family regulator
MKEVNLNQSADILKALAHPMRLAIIRVILDSKKISVNAISDILKLEQSTTSHHLGMLKNRDIISYCKEGKQTYYFIKNKTVKNLLDCIRKCVCNA